jgi:hypothetical protein
MKSHSKLVAQLLAITEQLAFLLCQENQPPLQQDEQNWLWGEKETVLTILTKLTAISVKLIPLHAKYHESDEQLEINIDDQKIVEDYVQKRLRQGITS